MRARLITLLAVLAAIAATLGFNAPAHASYVLKASENSSSGNTIRVVYQEDTDGHGFKLQSVRITDGGGADGLGSAGRGAKCWNENAVVHWSKGDNDTSLNRGESTIWYPNQTWSTATEMHCRWDFTKVYTVGGDFDDYVKVNMT